MGSGNLNSSLHVARQDLLPTQWSPQPILLISVSLPVGYSPHYSIVFGKNCCWSVQCTLVRYVGHRFGVELYMRGTKHVSSPAFRKNGLISFLIGPQWSTWPQYTNGCGRRGAMTTSLSFAHFREQSHLVPSMDPYIPMRMRVPGLLSMSHYSCAYKYSEQGWRDGSVVDRACSLQGRSSFGS